MTDTLLEIDQLTTVFPSASGTVRAVDGVSFQIRRGEILAVVGESGSGKSVTALSATRLVPQPPAIIEAGTVLLDGTDMLKLPPAAMRRILGRRIGFLFQNAFAALHPMIKVGEQLVETIMLHRNLGRTEAARLGADLVRSLGFPDPETMMTKYAFEITAGDAQRMTIAIALSGEPDLLIADEPTSLLDAIAQDEILSLIKKLQERTNMAVWLITHDFGVVSRLAETVLVMYAGKLVESGPVDQVLRDPSHPYTRGLIASVPSGRFKGRLGQIAGEVPDLTALPKGCAFSPRCDRVMPQCWTQTPAMHTPSERRAARCWLYADG